MKPTDLWANYSLETVDTVQGIFIPLTDLPGLTSAEANATTGNGGEVIRQLLFAAHEGYASLPTPPTKTTIQVTITNDTGLRKVQNFLASFSVVVPETAYQMENEPA